MSWWDKLLLWGGIAIGFTIIIVFLGTLGIALEDLWRTFVKHEYKDRVQEKINSLGTGGKK